MSPTLVKPLPLDLEKSSLSIQESLRQPVQQEVLLISTYLKSGEALILDIGIDITFTPEILV